ncbi:hypothetical protein EC968_009554 [Mortierella alpina]|nr:hypothetical protein EC968_009554 [Mortierella alpina]
MSHVTMAILNFIKSSSGKNKAAVMSASSKSSKQYPKATTLMNQSKTETAKTKTIPEFKVSAMAYAFSRV